MNKDISNKYEVGECPSEEFGDEKERFHFPIPQNAQEPSALMISFASIVIWGSNIFTDFCRYFSFFVCLLPFIFY